MITAENSSCIYDSFRKLGNLVDSFNVKSISSSQSNTSAVLMINVSDTKELESITDTLYQECGVSSISFYNSAAE